MRRRGGRVTVRRGPGLLGTMARTAVIAGTASATVRAVDQAGQRRQAAAAQQAYTQEQLAALQANQEALAQQQPDEAETDDSFDAQLIQIQKLSALKDQGLLTEEEFAAKKRQILGI